jgi:hypothetical protein
VVDIESEQARFWWTYDSLSHLQDRADPLEFGDSVWKENRIDSFAYDQHSVTFDAPEDWLDEGETGYTIRLTRSEDGCFRYSGDCQHYEAAEAKTGTHLVLTGRWSDEAEGTGMFIAVFPSRTSAL